MNKVLSHTALYNLSTLKNPFFNWWRLKSPFWVGITKLLCGGVMVVYISVDGLAIKITDGCMGQ
jgi:hypothetical protein